MILLSAAIFLGLLIGLADDMVQLARQRLDVLLWEGWEPFGVTELDEVVSIWLRAVPLRRQMREPSILRCSGVANLR